MKNTSNCNTIFPPSTRKFIITIIIIIFRLLLTMGQEIFNRSGFVLFNVTHLTLTRQTMVRTEQHVVSLYKATPYRGTKTKTKIEIFI